MIKPYYQDVSRAIYCGDCLDVLPQIKCNSIDLLLTDPPYGISFMGKDWDRALPDMQIWRECFRVLKPGAFAFVMSIPRADCLSRMIISLEDAGFLVNFTPIFWAYASGFPKAQNIGKAVDKRLGNKREIVGHYVAPDGHWRDCEDHKPNEEIRNPSTKYGYKTSGFRPVDKGKSALEGSYGGFQPKPAVEVIIVAMKPLSEKTFIDQALKNGKGITWLDDCMIPYGSEQDKEGARFGTQMDIRGGNLKTPQGIKAKNVLSSQSGRFPANLLVSDDVLDDGRNRKTGRMINYRRANRQGYTGPMPEFTKYEKDSDSGSFSRYFDLDKWAQKTFPFLIVPKASKSEKDTGKGSMVEKGLQPGRNIHPTVKPLKLMSYLITLGSREGDTVLDNFLGSGTTAVACQLLNRKCIGIEIKEEYCKIAVQRGRARLL